MNTSLTDCNLSNIPGKHTSDCVRPGQNPGNPLGIYHLASVIAHRLLKIGIKIMVFKPLAFTSLDLK
jgi:hypothetical protein